MVNVYIFVHRKEMNNIFICQTHPSLPANKEFKLFHHLQRKKSRGISSKKPLWSSPPPVSIETVFSKIILIYSYK